jgi:cytoskeletal protein RodZ
VAVSKDTLKTIGGLVVIVLIIVGAFLYGDAQHNNQVRQDQNAKQSAQSPATTQVGQAPAKPSGAPQPSSTPQVSTAPSATPTPVVAGQGGTTSIPQTGPGDELVPLAFIALAWVLYRRALPRRAAKPASSLR